MDRSDATARRTPPAHPRGPRAAGRGWSTSAPSRRRPDAPSPRPRSPCRPRPSASSSTAAARRATSSTVAELAGVMGGKRTAELIPLCHPLAADRPRRGDHARPRRRRAADPRRGGDDRPDGVEMEAMTAASVAALTVYDMVKGVERGVEIRGRAAGLEDRRQERRVAPAGAAGGRPAPEAAAQARRADRGPDRRSARAADGGRRPGAPLGARAHRQRPERRRHARRTRRARRSQARLEALGFTVERRVVPDERAAIEAALVDGAAGSPRSSSRPAARA